MKFLYENFLQFYLLALTSIIQHYKLGKKSITKDIESIKGSEILKYIKNIPNINTNENDLISCTFYEQYNGYYIFTNDKNQ
ncbi:hypothetical protein [Spiroplasma endosymbiont of Nomada rufipes]|uniref:hypothetical protein n=1 Tax=Spiroplasma endosymbiont of Nomada rufipes TaxID=3077933 RepID=UPI00376F3761